MNRRELITAVPAIAAGGFLAACVGQTPLQTLDMLAQKAEEIDQTLRAVVPQLHGIPPATAAKVVFWIDKVSSYATQIAAAATMADAKPLAQQLVIYTEAVLGELAKYPLSDQVRAILAAVQVALPIIVGIIQGA